MKHADQYGLPLTTDSVAAVDAFVDAFDLFQCGRIEAGERFSEAIRLDPSFALPRAFLAYQLQFDSKPTAAVAQILVATRHAQHASRRERQLIEALRRAFVGDYHTACELMVDHLAQFPREVLIIRELVLLRGYGGETRSRPKLAEELGRVLPELGGDPWFMAVYAFVLCECGEVEIARRLAEGALTLRPEVGAAAHSLAHTYFEAREDSDGLEFSSCWLSDHGDTYLNSGHLTWHSALCALALSEPERARDLYRGQKSSTPSRKFGLEDNASLLWRLQLRGLDVECEWEEVLDHEPSAAPNRAFGFAHLGFAFAAVGDVYGLRRLGEQAADEAARRPQQAFRYLIPLFDALACFARGQWSDAACALEVAIVDAPLLGGSKEQHTIYDETLAVAYRRAGEHGEARRVVQDRLHGRHVDALAT